QMIIYRLWRMKTPSEKCPNFVVQNSVNGQAQGVGLQIQREGDGEIAIPGQGMSMSALTAGTKDLTYRLRLVANNRPLASGQYYSQLRFKLDYE
ncbi:fimbrial protein, partial [Providencia rettgeri]